MLRIEGCLLGCMINVACIYYGEGHAIVTGTHDGSKNHVFPNVYTEYLVLTTTMFHAIACSTLC